jgi:uncharacterized RDD family membrane protein YckC
VERLFLLAALAAVVYGLVRDAIDLFQAHEAAQPETAPEPEFRHFNPPDSSPAMDYVKLGFAYVVDLVPFLVVLLILHVAFVPLSNLNPGSSEPGADGIDRFIDATIALFEILAAFGITRLAHIALVARTQRSPGWLLMGYRVVNADGTRPAFWSYLGRSFEEYRSATWRKAGSGGRSTSRIRYVARECKLVADEAAPSGGIVG